MRYQLVGVFLVDVRVKIAGNWGCGCFRGDPVLKFLIQMMCASLYGVELIYLPFEEKYYQTFMRALENQVKKSSEMKEVGEVFESILTNWSDII